MNDNATSLDRLHDLALPPPVSWWPPAPGWYLLLAVVAATTMVWVVRRWFRWRADAYRRAALRELQSAHTVSAVSEVLRRAALSIAPRSTVAELTGAKWPQWLAETSPDPIPSQVRDQLASGIYAPDAGGSDLETLRRYASNWILHHRGLQRFDTTDSTPSTSA
jgi:hypothetical protein